MPITLDYLLGCITGEEVPEKRIQKLAHDVGALIYVWNEGVISNAQIASILGLDLGDGEIGTAKTHIGTLTKAEVLAIEKSMILAQNPDTANVFDKAFLRSLFGLP